MKMLGNITKSPFYSKSEFKEKFSSCFKLEFLFDINDTDKEEKILKQLGKSLNEHAFWIKNFSWLSWFEL